MNGPRAKVRLHEGKWGWGTVLDDHGDRGPSRVLVDATYPARLVEPKDWTYQFRCVFERIGRTRGITPVVFESRTADDLARQVYRFARPHLGSRTVEVLVNVDEQRGVILVGAGRPGGSFTVERLESETEVPRG